MTDQNGENPAEPTEGPATRRLRHTAAAPRRLRPARRTGVRRSQYDFDQAKATLQGAHKFDLGIIAAGLIAFIASLLPFYTVSVSAGGFGGPRARSAPGTGSSAGSACWSRCLAAVAVRPGAVQRGEASRCRSTRSRPAAFVLALLCLILALFVDPSGGCGGAGAFGIHCSIGRGFGYWLALIAVLAGAALSVMRLRESTAKTA